jgi:hypothetical protein
MYELRMNRSRSEMGTGEWDCLCVFVRGSVSGYLRKRQIEMIKLVLLKICAFLFAYTHLSFLPYCQQQQQSSVMSVKERTYIMVKVCGCLTPYIFLAIMLTERTVAVSLFPA